MKLINVDLGECLQPDPDNEVMPLTDMANIACGGHAGDQASIINTLNLAKQHNVTIGAHPSYIDHINFGRKSHTLSSQQLFLVLEQQMSLFKQCCEQYECAISYIKPHGALYHDMMRKSEVLEVICQFILDFDASLSLLVQAGINSSQMEQVSKKTGIKFIYEAFADRAYDGKQLVPRSQSGAMLLHPEQIVEQYHSFCDAPSFFVDTVCFHSDNPASVQALKLIKQQ